jgi:uncharacterized membrane protein YidH (DUF202 family)
MRIRLGAFAYAVAGVLFALYPALRPYSDETSMQGASAFGSNAWLLAHMLAMVAFTLLMVGLLGLYTALRDTAAEKICFWALVAGLLGVGLTLPFYGGEAFGLHAIGQEALRQHSPALVKLAGTVRGDPQDYMFAAGLLLIAFSGILVAVAVWRSGAMPKWSGVPFAVAMALYLPQFFGTPVIRVAHGLLVAAGCLWLAVVMWRLSLAQVRRAVSASN